VVKVMVKVYCQRRKVLQGLSIAYFSVFWLPQIRIFCCLVNNLYGKYVENYMIRYDTIFMCAQKLTKWPA